MTPKSVLKSCAFPDVAICIPKVFPSTGTNDMQSWAAGNRRGPKSPNPKPNPVSQ